MKLLEQIEQDYIAAFKNRETDIVDVLRLLKSALKNEAIKIGGLGTDLTDPQAMTVLNREAKQRKDAIEQYTSGNRLELAAKEQKELEIIESYLPQSMNEDDLAKIVDEVIAETGVSSKSDMGKVMGALKAKLTNPADMSKAAGLVNQKLI